MEDQNERKLSEAIKYGNVFNVKGELASKAITPRDAALLQSAENMVIGMPQKDGPAAIMRSAAVENVKHGFVGVEDVTDIVQKEGVTLLEVLGKCSGPIGGALEAAILSSAGEKPIVKSDAAVIEAAEMHATGKGREIPGGLAEEAYSAADRNLQAEDKITLRDILVDAKKKIPDKPVSRAVAEAVIVAEVEHNPDMQTQPGGIVSLIAGAARLNEQK
ncbi:hypothetical protein LIER_41026 [Lithospermum erythrorhizon]|uniref:SMP domain-containing protein n=1 Tax=Lithospermum erythrorhizon TaxID=34254 RepID=A0AAV3R654_LITER